MRKNRRKVFLLREKPLEKGAFRTYDRERKGNKKILTAKKGLEERKGDGEREIEREREREREPKGLRVKLQVLVK